MRTLSSLGLAVLVTLGGSPLTLDAQARCRANAPAAAPDATLAEYAAMGWRNIGPSRGGRSVAVSGVRGMPLTYFAGYTGGGLWRTDDAGISWRNISDGFFR